MARCLKLLCTGLVVFLISPGIGSAEAQIRFNRQDRRDTLQRVGPPTNAAHERAKIQAEEAYQTGDFDRAIDLTTSVLNQNNQDHVAYYLRGSARVESGIQRGDPKLVRDGIADAREAIRLGGTGEFDYYLPYLYGMINLSAIEQRNAHADVAMKVVDGVLARTNLTKEQRANLLYQRGMAQMFLKDFDGAASSFLEAIRLVPLHIGANMGLADAYVVQGKDDKAVEAFAAAIERFPENPLIYNNRGKYQQDQGNNEGAIADFTQAVQLDPNYFVAFSNRGFAKMDSGDAEDAEKDFTASLKINPDQPTVYSLRGTARLAQGKAKPAIEDYEKVLELDPKNPVALSDLGFAKFFAGNFSGALETFDQVAALDKSARFLDPWRFWSLVLSGQVAAAKEKFADRLKTSGAQRDWFDTLIAYLNGSISDKQLLAAVEPKDETLKLARTCEAQYFIGQYIEHGGQSEEAQMHYREALKTGAFHLSAYRGAQYALHDFSHATSSIEQTGNHK